MMVIAPLLLCLLSALVEVHSQTAPYLSFMGNNIPNHSYVDLNTVTGGNSELRCNTDLVTCCTSVQGDDRGNWFFPNGNELGYSTNVAKGGNAQRVLLYYRGSGGPSGIYRCDIGTVAVNNNDSHETVYVGLYTSGGDVTIAGGMTFTVISDLSGGSHQFTLTSISIGGPATTVTWTRDSETVLGGMTVFNNAVTAQYTHTLTVTGRLGGQYQCTVTNRKPSSGTVQLTVQVASAPTGLTAVREGPTGIRVSWTPPTPLGDTTGYRIYYSGGSSGSENVSDVSTDNLLLTGLQNGASYTISIVGTSNHLNSDHVNHQNNITLIPAPDQPTVVMDFKTSTTVSLSWTATSGTVDTYVVTWLRDTLRECPGADKGSTTITGDSTSYTISGLQEDISYTITVTASNAAGSAVSDPVTAMTGEAETYFMLQLTGYIHCTDWINHDMVLKLADITRAVEEELSSSCQCQITNGTIDRESLGCSEVSPNSVTYQARLNGTCESSRASLISLIEDWVSTGPTIRVRGVLVRVGEECSTAISDLSEGVCSSSGAQTESSAGAIGGLAAAVAVVLVVAVAVIVVIVLVMRKSSGPIPGVTEDLPMTAFHGNKNRDVSTLKGNEAYNIVKQCQVVEKDGKVGIQEYEEIGATDHSIARHQEPKSAAEVRKGGGRGKRGESGRGGGGGGGGRGGGSIEASSTSPQLLSTAGMGEGETEERLYEEVPGGE